MRLDSGGSAGAGKLTGTHYIAYLPLTWTATKPPQDPRANAQTYGYDYFLEYRAATGLEAWTDDRTHTDPQGVVRSTPGGGVILTRAKVGTPTSVFPAELMNFYPPAPGAPDTQRHPGLSAGEVLHAPDGLFSLHVSAADNDRASVALSFPGLRKVARWSGQDRYDASARISGASFAPGVNTAYLASGEVYTDALSGAPVAGMTRGPVLLTKRDSLPSAISTELRRLRPGRIVVLGGPATISESVAAQAESLTGARLERWWGPDRFSTSARISAENYDPGVDTVYVASGRIFTDALSGAPVAGKQAGPVLLVDTTKLPDAIEAELTRLQPRRIVVLGGPNTISPEVESRLATLAGSVERWAGPDRFSTSAQITSRSYDPGVGTVYIASGRVFSDALSGAPVAGMTAGPVLLVDTAKVADSVATELSRLRPKKIVVLGGPNTITYAVQATLGRYLAP
jgi:putative cell wall-binding protein